ncbi:unnamed protein product [Paramecium sonneborni]|uniref:Uncharacterized protein n=1 Tax=Paramecium sonneborni TaxID=65129 RepID=A0A8S1RQQ8_9CILI|nr:unnamed protein product [Paramecium sonneborni]
MVTLADQLSCISLKDYAKLLRIVVLGVQSADTLSKETIILNLLNLFVIKQRSLKIEIISCSSKCSSRLLNLLKKLNAKKFTYFEEILQQINELTDRYNDRQKTLKTRLQNQQAKTLIILELTLVGMKKSQKFKLYFLGITLTQLQISLKKIEEIPTYMLKHLMTLQKTQ